MATQEVAQSVPALDLAPTVYFILAENGLVKIGFARDFDDRFRRLVCASPVSLDLLALVSGGREVEREYHSRFRLWRRHGEWFTMSPEIEAEIERLNDIRPISRLPLPISPNPSRCPARHLRQPQQIVIV